MENNQPIYINPEKFAYHFMDTMDIYHPNDNLEVAAKQRLAAYLEAYLLIEQFNNFEASDFNKDQKISRDRSITYENLLSRVMKFNKY